MALTCYNSFQSLRYALHMVTLSLSFQSLYDSLYLGLLNEPIKLSQGELWFFVAFVTIFIFVRSVITGEVCESEMNNSTLMKARK